MARFIPEGLSVHLIRRGNNRGPIFIDDYDRETFLALLESSSARHAVAVNAFVLMTNHYHAIVTPPDGARLSLMMRDLGRDYVLRYNERHDRIGTLWAGKPNAIPIPNERYWLTCLRYIEQNPVRAQMVDDAAAHPWSSYPVHALGEQICWLARHPVYLALGATDTDRQQAYRALFADRVTNGEIVRQRMIRSSLKASPVTAPLQIVLA